MIPTRENLSHSHIVHHKSHMDQSGVEPGLLWEGAGDDPLSHGTALPECSVVRVFPVLLLTPDTLHTLVY
jgi:hypothetical protein